MNFKSTLDHLRKLAASRPGQGGEHLQMEVALGPSAQASAQNLMQQKKVTPKTTMPLSEVQRRASKL